jgi:ethanolamine ammonia-lyase large subunit
VEAAETKTKHSQNCQFEEQFENWLETWTLKDRLESIGRFFVGTTSDALKSIGVDDYKIYWNEAKVAKIMSEHSGMTAEVIKLVPEILEHPILVMQSKTVKNRITMFGDVADANGKPVLAALELSPNKTGEIANYAVIASAYGKKGAQNFINSSEILYVEPNKKRIAKWLLVLGLQLPSSVTT